MQNKLGLRVKKIREAANLKSDGKIGQKEASSLINSDRRWTKFEGDPKVVDLAAIELFCIKTGVRFTPNILESTDPIEFESKGDTAHGSSPAFLTLTKFSLKNHLCGSTSKF